MGRGGGNENSRSAPVPWISQRRSNQLIDFLEGMGFGAMTGQRRLSIADHRTFVALFFQAGLGRPTL